MQKIFSKKYAIRHLIMLGIAVVYGILAVLLMRGEEADNIWEWLLLIAVSGVAGMLCDCHIRCWLPAFFRWGALTLFYWIPAVRKLDPNYQLNAGDLRKQLWKMRKQLKELEPDTEAYSALEEEIRQLESQVPLREKQEKIERTKERAKEQKERKAYAEYKRYQRAYALEMKLYEQAKTRGEEAEKPEWDWEGSVPKGPAGFFASLFAGLFRLIKGLLCFLLAIGMPVILPFALLFAAYFIQKQSLLLTLTGSIGCLWLLLQLVVHPIVAFCMAKKPVDKETA